MNKPKIYKVEITLTCTDFFGQHKTKSYPNPKIYRQVSVQFDKPLEKFHAIIQANMGWSNCHLHQFETSDSKTTANSEFEENLFEDEGEQDGENLTIDSVLKKKSGRMMYIYNMGDNWDHEVTLQEILPVDSAQTYSQCIWGRQCLSYRGLGKTARL